MMKMGTLLLSFLLAQAATAAPVPVVNQLYPAQEAGSAWTAIDAAPVAAGVFVFSKAYDLWHATHFEVEAWCTGSSPNVQIDWYGSRTNEEADFSLLTSIATITAAAPNQVKFYQFGPVPTRYGRLRLFGNAGASADTTCTVKLYLSNPIDP